MLASHPLRRGITSIKLIALSTLNYSANSNNLPLRPVRFFSPDVELTRRADGSLLMRSVEPLGQYDHRVGDWLDRWAQEAPDRIFIVEQTPTGERYVSYGEARETALLLAEGLLGYGLGPDRPLAILAANGIDHALVMLAALYVGIPIAPIAPAYALQSIDYAKLFYAFKLLTPGMVVVDDGELYRKAIEHALKTDIPVIALRNASLNMRDLASLQGDGSQRDEVCAAAARVGRETIAKFLFTSGSTGMPKAVINTHGMICCNSQMKRQVAPFLAEEPPVMVDWAPWNHTAGSNSNFSIILHNGGTLYVDPGKPTPALFDASLKLLRRVSPTIYFNVPRGYELLIPHLQADRAFCERFFQRLKFLWYAAASMQPATWFDLERLAVKTVGHKILTVSGLGMTETAPIALFGNANASGPGVVGIPVAGVELKLIPDDNSFEVRYRGPNVTPGYWRDAAATEAAFDEEGFLRSGDLLSFIDPERPQAGLRFDGRMNEVFKLDSGTKVSAGKLRLDALDVLRPLANEIVVAGADRKDVRILVFPDWEVCAAAAGLERAAGPAQIAPNKTLRAMFHERLDKLYAAGTGSSNRIVAALLVEAPPSGAAGELTEKGTVNSRALQRNRPELLEALFGDTDERVLRVG
ncbi:MAG TPA: feruloyl-CoA synthase, partial [Terriglobales bacterium]|nr:feruloyl-CoA synthase [Terriglobales bacterium]